MQQIILSSINDAMNLVAEKLKASGSDKPVCYLPGNTNTIKDVERVFFDNPEMFRGTQIFQLLSLGSPKDWARAVSGGITPVTAFIGPGTRSLVNTGLARNIRCHLSKVPALFKGKWRHDVAFAHVSPPDNVGRVTLGLNAGLDFTAVKEAKFKVAIMNENMPRWHIGQYFDPKSNRTLESGCAMFLHNFDLVVYTKQDLVEHVMNPKAEEAEIATRIASHIISTLLKDADDYGNLPHTLQLGIGAIPDAIAKQLAEQNIRIDGIWSEMFSNGVLELYKKGLIRRTTGSHLRDHIVVGFVLGSRELYDTMHENPDFLILPQEYVNDPSLIGKNDYMASINSALTVSVAGEVAAATIGNKYYSDVGGQHDFATGADRSEGGIPIIALPSTARLKDGSIISKIVAEHPAGSHHTIGADLPSVIVTENGLADLRGKDDRERVEETLAIVHPELRSQITRQVRTLPAMQGIDSIVPKLTTLRNGEEAIVRPATHEDIELIREYLSHLSKEDRATRYFSSGVTLESLTCKKRLLKIYDESLDYINHGAFVVVHQGKVVGVTHAYKMSDGVYELSFSRDSEMSNMGIGTKLLQMNIDWAEAKGTRTLSAVILASNHRMISLFVRALFKIKPNPDDSMTVICEGQIGEIRLAA